MPAAPYTRLVDVVPVGATITVTVPWQTVAGDNEGAVQAGTATYTITASDPSMRGIMAFCDDLDRMAEQGTAVVT